MTESAGNLLNQILSKNPGMSREELLSLVERKKQESHGLLSDEGAVRLLAQQLAGLSGEGVNISDQRISSVQAGLSDATISGEILSVSQLREFQRSDGSVGKLVRVKLKDGSGRSLVSYGTLQRKSLRRNSSQEGLSCVLRMATLGWGLQAKSSFTSDLVAASKS